MTLIGNIKKAEPYEWILLVIAIACLVYAFGCLHGCAAAGNVVKKAEAKGTVILISTVVAGGVGLLVGAPVLPLFLVGAVSSTTTIVLQDDPVNIQVQDGGAIALGGDGKTDAAQLQRLISEARRQGREEGYKEKDAGWGGFVRKLKGAFVLAIVGLFVWLRRRWLWKWLRERNWAALWHAFAASAKSAERALKEKT